MLAISGRHYINFYHHSSQHPAQEVVIWKLAKAVLQINNKTACCQLYRNISFKAYLSAAATFTDWSFCVQTDTLCQ